MIGLLGAYARQAVVDVAVTGATVTTLALTSSHHRRCGIELAQRYAQAGRTALLD